MYSFEVPRDINQRFIEIKIESNSQFVKRTLITEVIYAKGYLFIASGKEGLDVYKIVEKANGSFPYVGKLDSDFLNLDKDLDVQDLAIDLENRLYIADYNNGVIILKINEKATTLEASFIVLHSLTSLVNT